MPSKFNAGRLVWTRGVNKVVADNTEFAKFAVNSLKRHLNGDWGDLDDEDKRTNEKALTHGERLLSAYKDARFPQNGNSTTGGEPGRTIWIITEADRSATTILFPDEY